MSSRTAESIFPTVFTNSSRAEDIKFPDESITSGNEFKISKAAATSASDVENSPVFVFITWL